MNLIFVLLICSVFEYFVGCSGFEINLETWNAENSKEVGQYYHKYLEELQELSNDPSIATSYGSEYKDKETYQEFEYFTKTKINAVVDFVLSYIKLNWSLYQKAQEEYNAALANQNLGSQVLSEFERTRDHRKRDYENFSKSSRETVEVATFNLCSNIQNEIPSYAYPVILRALLKWFYEGVGGDRDKFDVECPLQRFPKNDMLEAIGEFSSLVESEESSR